MSASFGVPEKKESPALELVLQIVSNIKYQLNILDADFGSMNQVSDESAKVLATLIEFGKSTSAKCEQVQREFPVDVSQVESLNKRISQNFSFFHDLEEVTRKIDELCSEIKEGQYDYFRACSELLGEIYAQFSAFQQFSALPRIVTLKSRLNSAQEELKRRLQWAIVEVGPFIDPHDEEISVFQIPSLDKMLTKDTQILTQSYLLVNVLGKDFRRELLQNFAQVQLLAYEANFSFAKGGKYSGLEHVEKRFLWFKKLCKLTSELNIFPNSWCISLSLYLEFIRRTKLHIVDVLAEYEKSQRTEENLTGYVGVLIKSLKSFLNFESEIKNSLKNDLLLLEKLDEVPAGQYSEALLKDDCDTVSEAFDPHLSPYIQLEKARLNDLIYKLMREEEAEVEFSIRGAQLEESGVPANKDAAPQEEVNKAKVTYESSQRLFEFIKTSVKRCSSLSTGVLLVDLSREYRLALQEYIQALKLRCPTPINNNDKNSKVVVYPELSEGKMMELFRIITTAEYCYDVIPQLEGMMKQLVKAKYADKIYFQPQTDACLDLVSHAIGIIVGSVAQKFHEPFRTMRNNNNWAKEEYSVNDCSKYVLEIVSALKHSIPSLRNNMTPTHFMVVCNKISIGLLEQFSYSVWNTKRKISRTSGSQMLLDINVLTEFMRDMPHYKLPDNSDYPPISMAYGAVITKQSNQIEVVLKLLCTDDDSLRDMFKALWPAGTNDNYEALLNIRLNKNDVLQQAAGAVADVSHITNQIGSKVTGAISNSVGQTTVGKATGSGFHMLGGAVANAGKFFKTVGDDLKAMAHDANVPNSAQGPNSRPPQPAGGGLKKAVLTTPIASASTGSTATNRPGAKPPLPRHDDSDSSHSAEDARGAVFSTPNARPASTASPGADDFKRRLSSMFGH